MKLKIDAALRSSNQARKAAHLAVANLFAESELPFNLAGELDDSALRAAALDEAAAERQRRADAKRDQLDLYGEDVA